MPTRKAASKSAPRVPATLARIISQLDEAERSASDPTLSLGKGITLHVSSLDRVLFPKDGITKGDVMRYYTRVAPYLLPIVKDRPLSLKRYPAGITSHSFFQQKAPPEAPETVRVETIVSEAGERQERLIGGSLATLLYCVQLGAFEVNPWNARVGSLEFPDYTVIDLDPGDKAPFSSVVQVALWVKEELDAHGIRAAVKTSGASGMHVFIPLPPRTEERLAEGVSRRIATAVATAHPREATVERALKARGARQIYVDYGQNARGKTVAAAYSVRARAGATVSTPLQWKELTPSLDPRDFTVETVIKRLAKLGDLWGAAMKKPNRGGSVTDS